MNHTLPCPQCKTTIHFDPQALISGQSFGCSSCGSQIKLSPESKKDAEKALNQFNQLKKKIANRK